MQDIKPGDEVRLKSGGPVMTVEYTDTTLTGENFAVCIWFDKQEELKRERLDPVVLVMA